MLNLSINNSEDRAKKLIPLDLFKRDKIPTRNSSQLKSKNTLLRLPQFSENLLLKFEFLSRRQEGLSKLFFNSLFIKAGNEMKLNPKHALNQPYPITKESILNSIDSLNREFDGSPQYKIDVDKNIHEKVDGFLNNLRQDLNIKIKTPFKELVEQPLMMQNGDVLLLNAQIEGGINTWLGGEIICKSVLITLMKDATGKFVEKDHVLPSSDYGFRSIITKESESKISAEVKAKTYSGSDISFDIDVNIDLSGKIYINTKKP